MSTAEPWACGLVSIIGQLCNKVEQLEDEKAEVINALDFSRQEFKKMTIATNGYKAEVKSLAECSVKLGQITGNHGVAIDTLEEKAIRADTYQRGKNLLFRGIAEDGRNTQDDCLHKIDNLLDRRLNLDSSKIKVNRCHRIGPIPQRSAFRDGRPPPTDFSRVHVGL